MTEERRAQIAKDYLTLYGPQTPEQSNEDQKKMFSFQDIQEILDLCWSEANYRECAVWNRILYIMYRLDDKEVVTWKRLAEVLEKLEEATISREE